jgi:hypothetical protein
LTFTLVVVLVTSAEIDELAFVVVPKGDMVNVRVVVKSPTLVPMSSAAATRQ